MTKRIKIAITGAAGQIGYALIFRVASGQMFGPDVAVELSLLELPLALPALQGVAMELDDGAYPLLKKVTITSDVNVAMKDVNWAVLVGSVPRKVGMERSELLKINGDIFKVQGRALNDHAAGDARVFVVGNPCNTNCLIAMQYAPDMPRNRFYAMTLLDELRARYQLAAKAEVDVTAVTQMNIWGNHSATQYPDFYHAMINQRPATEVITDLHWLQNDFITTVQQRGAAVLKARGASSAASAANAALMTVYNLTHDTAQGETFSVARCSEGEYGIDAGLIFSVPCRTEGGVLKVITGLSHNDFSKERIQKTLNELREERDMM
ncbi:MAG: malate dehydrogenase [Gammaproteobacteria bacterium RIFCSPHIGHO2_12_FULL_42_10]|nr:MAG: malate dehydrogenase [Gammaproteobacteria bacterium RIFCSPHIGHO2_12_FULL_42_10]